MNRALRALLYLLPPVLVLASVWLPEVRHYGTQGVNIDAATIAALRTQPDGAVLEELRENQVGARAGRTPLALVVTESERKRGVLDLPGTKVWQVQLPFAATDLLAGSPSRQLKLASLFVPDLLLTSLAQTGDPRYMDLAQEYLHGWLTFVNARRLPYGFIWNDHAVAARTLVLSRFWERYRDSEEFSPEFAAMLLERVARDGQLLARASHYTIATNHGTMQNLALLHIAVAFPGLPGSDDYVDLAIARQSAQLEFLTGEDGIALEHSAGYQEFSVILLGMLLRYLTLLDQPIPPDWQRKYAAAIEFYLALRRPDGSLPIYGDTNSTPRERVRVTTVDARGRASPLAVLQQSLAAPQPRLVLHAGYALHTGGVGQEFRQLVVIWENFIGGAHKHADEMSVLYYSRGRSWWRNVGYWPYGDPLRRVAVGWSGSNAPSFTNERADAQRTTRLLGEYAGPGDHFLDLQRESSAGATLRRQVLATRGGIYLILDHGVVADAGEPRQEQVWTVPAEVELRPNEVAGGFRLVAAGGEALTAVFAGGPGHRVEPVNASREPFGGWIATSSGYQPTDALHVTNASDSWSLVAWGEPTNIGPAALAVDLAEYRGPADWQVRLRAGQRSWDIGRQDAVVTLDDGGGPQRSVTVRAATSDDLREAQRAAYLALAERYPTYRYLFPFRVKVSAAIAAAAGAQWLLGLGWVFHGRFRRRPYWVALGVGWLALGLWLNLVYFQT